MIEIILFLIAVSVFYYLIQYLGIDKAKGKIIVKEEEAEKADDQYGIYQGEDIESQIDDNLEKAERLLTAGASKNCEKLFIEAIKLEPKNIRAYEGLGKLFIMEKNYKEAALALEKVVSLDEKNDATWNNLGFVYHELEKYSKSAFSYEKAIEYNNKVPHRYINLAISLTKMNDLEAAASALEKAVKVSPKKETYEFLLNIYRKLGDSSKISRVAKILAESK